MPNLRISFILSFFLISLFLLVKTIYAQELTSTPTPTPTPDSNSGNSSRVADLQKQISDLQGKIGDLQGQEKTLSNSIAVMDDRILLANSQIAYTKQKIINLTGDIATSQKKISSLNGNLQDLTKVLLKRIVTTYEVGNVQPIEVVASSNSIDDYASKKSYMKIVQEHDKKLIYDTQQAKLDYQNIKDIRENQKNQVETLQKQLEDQTAQLAQAKKDKQNLLAQTQGSESNYQKQLSSAKAELAGFSRFVTSQGGASLLSGQTSCDSWGCYYNQRDSQWGSILINGQSGYTMAGYGCLITSIAMVASHMGQTVSPGDIATSTGDNFSFDTAMLKFTIHVNGKTISRNGVSSLDSALPNGPVIVGIYAYGGTHFVVIKSGSNGNYVMNDPYIEGGRDISFTDHYSLGSIFERDQLSF